MFIKSLTTIVLFFTLFNVTANNRYGSYEGQGRWSSASTTPVVEVYLKGAYIYAKSFIRSFDLPESQLKTINSNLLNEYKDQFILVEDFNNDSFNDIGVLKSAGLGGSPLCYSIFEYMPEFYVYRSKSNKTVCTN